MWDLHVPLDPRFRATTIADSVMAAWVEENLGRETAEVFVAEDPPGEVEGYCVALVLENLPVVPWPAYGYISEISVRRPGRGTGRRLLETAHAWLRERGIAYVETSVSVRNEAARRFWRGRGYTEFLERLRLEL
jgi:GNAT superfamily N-acetyltransferase